MSGPKARWEERSRNPWGDVLRRPKKQQDIDAPPPNTERGNEKTKNKFLKRERQYGNVPNANPVKSQVQTSRQVIAPSASVSMPKETVAQPAPKKARTVEPDDDQDGEAGVGEVDGKEVLENRLYVGNLDKRVTEYMVYQLCKRYGKIVKEQFMWYVHGPRRGEPRGYCFIEYSTRNEALLAKEKLNGRMTMGKNVVVRFVNERVNFQPVQMGAVVQNELRKNGPTLEWANQAKEKEKTDTNCETALIDIKLDALRRKIRQLKEGGHVDDD